MEFKQFFAIWSLLTVTCTKSQYAVHKTYTNFPKSSMGARDFSSLAFQHQFVENSMLCDCVKVGELENRLKRVSHLAESILKMRTAKLKGKKSFRIINESLKAILKNIFLYALCGFGSFMIS